MTQTTQDTAQDIAALVLRVASGALFLAHGLTKLLVFTPAGTAGFFESLGLPGVLGYLTMLAELGGGLALILGVGVRLISIPLVAVLLGATWVHSGNGWGFASAGGGWEFPLFWAATQAVIGLLGAGAFALRLPALERRLGAFA
ncbi:putative oxidoreductase [Rhodobacter aestuarii]|uniref:Putative oxidoreductase n=1 Tax=Rhodobacter aestuarii TaxID=453582 RepID=A0A1N7LZL3_9RHOB|nr:MULTISPECIES: DoxX family protein [Rhodobacter]PTV94741.1 putative oxidoreductase [Rhodobacter aestuarii]SIS79257.1 putative oxidoreductase [Rhodobacter aestuarii]SOC14638.1 putative oxidoreductase [Rhodobacter sp. JA431]